MATRIKAQENLKKNKHVGNGLRLVSFKVFFELTFKGLIC